MKARHWFLAGVLGAMSVVQAHAQEGANAGGYLVFYTNDAIVYTSDGHTGGSGITCANDPCPLDPAINCSSNKQIVQNAATSGKVGDTAVWWLLAGWPEEACPALKGLVFGLDYDPAKVSVVQIGTDADFETKTQSNHGEDWPAPGSGTAITWNSPKRSHLTEVYWFAAYIYDLGPTEFKVAPHRSQGWPVFGDDSIPAVLDSVGIGYDPNNPTAGFLPVMGFDGAAGNNGDVTPVLPTTWGKVKAKYGR